MDTHINNAIVNREIKITVKCPECKETQIIDIPPHHLEGFAANKDGTYTEVENPCCQSCNQQYWSTYKKANPPTAF